MSTNTETILAEYEDHAGRRSRVTGRDEQTGLVTALRPRGGAWVPITNLTRLRELTTRHLAIPAPGDERPFVEQLEACKRLRLVT
jgi:hypothetical protein